MAYTTGSDIELFKFRYVFQFQDGDSLSCVITVIQVHL